METKNKRLIRSDGWAGSSMMEELHSDLVSKVLIKLDVKTLSRCRSVCKTWNRVISSHGFMAAHRRQSISRGLSDILFMHFDNRESSSEEEDDGFWKFTMVNPEETAAPDYDAEGGVNTKMGSYNNTNSINLRRMSPLDVTCDLLCFVDFNQCITLCNPRTGQVRTLPEPPIDNRDLSDLVFGYVDSTRQYVLMGMYEDDILEKYKMLKFCFRSNYECECNGDTSCSCSISSSSWKEIEEACPSNLKDEFDLGILVNNSVYWLNDYKGEIVSLELENDKFNIINFPNYPTKFKTLIDLKGNLAAGFKRTRSFDIWVLDQFKENCSHSCGWVRKYSIILANILAPNNGWYKVYNKSSRNGELIVTVKTPRLNKHYAWNPEKGTFRDLIDPCYGDLEPSSKYMLIGFFWESFFSFGV